MGTAGAAIELDPTSYWTNPRSFNWVSVAAGSGQWLTAWADVSNLFVSRVSSAGALLDVAPRLVAAKAGDPSVAFDGTRYLVVFEDFTTTGDWNIRAAFVAADGTVSPPFDVCTKPGQQQYPTVVFAGGQYVVGWEDTRSTPSRVYRARVQTDGTVTDPDGVLVPIAHTVGATTQSSARATVVAGEAVLTWLESTTASQGFLTAAAVHADGTLGAAIATSQNSDHYQSAAYHPTASVYLLGLRSTTCSLVRMGTNGLQQGSAIALGACDGAPMVAVAGSGWLAAWTVATGSGKYDTVYQHVDATGALVEATPQKLTTGGTWVPRVAYAGDGSTGLLAFPGVTGSVATRISTGAPLDAPFYLGFRRNSQRVPVLGGDATFALAAWTDDRSGTGTEIWATRVGADAKPIGTPVKIGASPGTHSIVMGGGHALVTSTDFDGTTTSFRAWRVSSAGVVEDAAPILIATPSTLNGADCVDTGTEFTCAWVDGYGPLSVYVRRIGYDGTILDATPLKLDLADAIAADLAAANGRGYVFYREPGQPLKVVRVKGGAFEDTTPHVLVRAIQPSFVRGLDDRVHVFGADDANKFHLGKVMPDGSWVGEADLPDPQPYGGEPYFADAEGYGYCYGTSGNAYFGHVSAPGYARLPATFSWSNGGTSCALTGTRAFVATYEAGASNAEMRVYARAVQLGKDLGATCSTDADCDTGHCVDGVCCESACTGKCEACDVAGSLGKCVPATGAPHGSHGACPGVNPGTACGDQCNGADRSACHVPSTSAKCGVDACTGGTQTTVSSCDGAGACVDTSKACGTHACAGKVCGTTCAVKADCAAGNYCNASHACVPLEGLGKACTDTGDCTSPASCVDGVCCESSTCGAGKTCAGASHKGICTALNGQTCAAATECASGFCVDGLCCESACADQCAACDVGGHEGHCFGVIGAPHGGRAACPVDATNACASKHCDGSTTTSCVALAAVGTTCRDASCSDGAAKVAATCDGAGTCVDPAATSCAGYACAADGKSCRTSCTGDADCTGTNKCQSGKCAPPPATTCSADGLSVVQADGTTKSCAPMLCRGSDCIVKCNSTDDCVTPNVCDGAGSCVAPPSTSNDSGGCAVAGDVAARGGRPWIPALASLTAISSLAARARRRRRRR
jgi:hypothetical protein